MIVFFGPAGAGKSMQGQLLAARHGWRWLSTGQLIRDSHDAQLLDHISTGKLVSDDVVNRIVTEALADANQAPGIILDGYPRNVDQAHLLLDQEVRMGQKLQLAILLDVPTPEIVQRLTVRGRADDTPDAIAKRHEIYHNEIEPILTFFEQRGIPVARVDGLGTVGQIHDRVESELVDNGIVSKE